MFAITEEQNFAQPWFQAVGCNLPVVSEEILTSSNLSLNGFYIYIYKDKE